MGSGFKALVAACAASASFAAQAVASDWTAIDLTPEGMGMAMAVSQNGTVVGCRNVGNETRAFVYANGARSDLAGTAGATSCALAVNNAGMIAGRINGEITVWQGGVARGLGVQGNVTGINESGTIVGATSDGQPASPTRAFMWSNGTFTDLGVNGSAIGINAKGQVAVFSDGKLLLWERGILRDLNASAGTARGFNDRGEIVGMTSFGHGPEPYVYDGTVRQIPGAYSYAGAVGINNQGQILGSGEGIYGFLMEQGEAVTIDKLAGAPWHHSEPQAINDRGWIVGQGGSPDFHALLLVPKQGSAPAAAENPARRKAGRTEPLVRSRER